MQIDLNYQRPSANPTRGALLTGRVFTGSVMALASAAVVADFIGPVSAGLTAPSILLMAAALILYTVAATVLYLRGDYIMRVFGPLWPMILTRVDEMQRGQRQRAFSFTFLAVMTVSSLAIGAHFGILFSDAVLVEVSRLAAEGRPETGFYPGSLQRFSILAMFVFMLMATLPQAYLAWTITPLDDIESEEGS